MSTPTTPTTIEPGKRILRTVVFVVLALLSAVPYVLGGVHVSNTQAVGVLAQIGAVAAALNALAVTPAGQTVLGWVGLDVAEVQKVTQDVQKTSADVQTIAPAAVQLVKEAVTDPGATTTLEDAVKDAPEVIASAQTVASDVKAVVGDVKGA